LSREKEWLYVAVLEGVHRDECTADDCTLT
jgi:hypothetical protein